MGKNIIGVFDSGIGGVTVLKEIVKLLPNEEYIYYSDSKNNPYGGKTDEAVIAISEKIVEYLISIGCKVIVIACNTASAKAAKVLRERYKNVIFIAIEPAYKMVYDYAYNKPTLVMATEGTIKSEKFNRLYNKYNNHKTILLPCKGLADIIEKGDEERIKDYLEKNLIRYKGKVENVVLGCTHYPLIKKKIQNVLGKITFFDGAERLAVHLKEVLNENNLIDMNKTNGDNLIYDMNADERNDNKNVDKTIEANIKFIDSSDKKEKEERFFKILNDSNIKTNLKQITI